MKLTYLALVAAIGAGGCALIDQPDSRRGPRTYAAAPFKPVGGSDAVEVVQYDLLKLLNVEGATTLEEALVKFPSEDGKARRNNIVGALLMASERNCDIYMENLRGAQATWRTGANLLGIGFGAAGSLFSDPATTRAMSALAGASSGAAGKLDDGVLNGMGAEILGAAVRAGRAPLLRSIETNLTKSYEDWPITFAVAEVVRYHGRCNIVTALNAAARAIEEQEQQTPGGGGQGSPATPAAMVGATGLVNPPVQPQPPAPPTTGASPAPQG